MIYAIIYNVYFNTKFLWFFVNRLGIKKTLLIDITLIEP